MRPGPSNKLRSPLKGRALRRFTTHRHYITGDADEIGQYGTRKERRVVLPYLFEII